jgi:hypothetical protein
MLPDTKSEVGLEAAWLMAIAYSFHPDDSFEMWQQVLALAPNNPIAAGNAARVLDDQKQWDKAIALYETAVKYSVSGKWRDNLQERLTRARWYRDRKDG